jgi:hypothetical protein
MNHIVLMLRFPGRHIGYYDILEETEKSADGTTRTLVVEGGRFEELEDVAWNFVYPLRERLVEVETHRRFVADLELAKREVQNNYQQDPSRGIQYRLSAPAEVHGGRFQNSVLIVWAGPPGLFIEGIRPMYNGWRFRHRTFEKENLEQLVNFWKEMPLRSEGV